MEHELVIVLDFGGQYNQLVARRVRDLNVYSEVLAYDTPIEDIKARNPIGIIFTGGPSVVTEKNAPKVDKSIFELGVPILGICYGCQLIGYLNGGEVTKSLSREYGKVDLKVNNKNILFDSIEDSTICWMSHTYHLSKRPDSFDIIASTSSCEIAAICNVEKNIYGVQFHPEVVNTIDGNKMLANFLYKICKSKKDWIVKNIVFENIKKLRDKIGDKKVLCALSGGVDSSVAAIMVNKAIGKNITCIFVDTGLMRLNECDEIEEIFKNQYDMNFIRINAENRFLEKLKGIVDPEEKRKIIGEEFIRIFEEEGDKIGSVEYLVQGTIYSDIIESGTKTSSLIKSHHNVGGLPDVIKFNEIIEPLKDLFKDEVRQIGIELGIPEELVYRQPFPGPGLGIRIIGEVTKKKLDILKQTDFIFRDEIKKAKLDKAIWQYFTVLTNVRSVGVMGDERTYGYTLALRAVSSVDAMSADWFRIPYDVLESTSLRIVNEVSDINRIVYDITSKPPSTIEWE